jgi:HlyD family secretion protein
LFKNSRLIVAGLSLVALILGGLIFRDIFVPGKNTSNSLNLYTVARRTVTASVTGTGNLVPVQQANVSFKEGGTLTAIDVRVGDHVTAGQVLAVIDPTPERSALASAQANLATAEANLQSAETPLTQDQINQLENSVTMAQQALNDTEAQTNLTNSQDASQVAADQGQLNVDQSALNFNATYQIDLQNLANAKTALQTAINTFDADGCRNQTYATYTAQCLADFNAASAAQATVTTDQGKVNADTAQVTADQTKLSQDLAKQHMDSVSGQHNINQAAAQVISAEDQLKTQTESKPNQVQSADAQLAGAQAAVQTAEQNLTATTLVAPLGGVIDSINGVVGDSVGAGSGGGTAEAPGTQAPLPSSTPSSAFIVIGDTSAMEAVIPFAESDAAKLAFNQDTQVTFDAVPNLTISGHLVAVATAATVQSGVVNYYATVELNQTNPALKQGMTANATVVVSKASNAITVPNLAITRLAGQAYVNVYAGGQEIQTPIQTGVVGDQYTEVTGGLNEGAQVIIPTLRIASGSGSTRGGFGGGGGAVRIGG